MIQYSAHFFQASSNFILNFLIQRVTTYTLVTSCDFLFPKRYSQQFHDDFPVNLDHLPNTGQDYRFQTFLSRIQCPLPIHKTREILNSSSYSTGDDVFEAECARREERISKFYANMKARLEEDSKVVQLIVQEVSEDLSDLQKDRRVPQGSDVGPPVNSGGDMDGKGEEEMGEETTTDEKLQLSDEMSLKNLR